MIIHRPLRSPGLLLLSGIVALGACEANPEIPNDLASQQNELVQYQNCNQLEQDLKNLFLEELDAKIAQMREWSRGYGPPMAGAEDGSGTNGDQGREEGTDYSGTNNQEAGVDEADFVKTDGYHVYVLNGNQLHIFATPEFGDLVPESTFDVEGWPMQMLMHKDSGRVAVFSQIDVYSLPAEHPLRQAIGVPADDGSWWWRVGNISKLTIIDASDRANPTLVRELFFEGWYMTARLVGPSVRLGAYGWLYVPGLDDWWWWGEDEAELHALRQRARARIQALTLADILPRAYERQPDGSFAVVPFTDGSCQDFYRPQNSAGRGITSLLSFDMLAPQISFDSDHIMTNWPTLYASRERLYLADPAYNWWWFWWNDDDDEVTNIHAFDTTVPGQSQYVGSGRVAGVLHNQFSMSEHEGLLRVATTVNRWNRWWDVDAPPSDNHVVVLEERGNHLHEIGHVGGIASGERIFAVRFDGPKGYVVTFQNIDPLFTIDLSDPAHPQVIGELEVPGFSSYIHPIADDRLLTIGVGGDENGANWRTQISLFDVTDFANPTLQDAEDLAMAEGWSWSEAQYEHKAFQYWAPKKLLAVPLSTYRYIEGPDGYWDYDYVSRLELVTVDTATGLARYGSIDHSFFFNGDPDRWWYWTDVRRSIFMGDFIYAISDGGITVHRTADLALVTQQTLPGYAPGSYYWWW